MASTPCPACGAPLVPREDLDGRQACCPRCGHLFSVPQPTPEEPPTAEDVSPTEASRPTPPLPPLDDGAAQRLRRRKRRSVFLALGLVAAVILLGCGGLATFVYITSIHGTEEPITAADRDMVITAERLALYLSERPSWDPRRGTFHKVRHLDGSRELTYEYTTPEGARDGLYISCTITIEPTPRDAAVSYTGDSLATRVGFQLQTKNLQEVQRNDLWKWGDESRCALLTINGTNVGNLFRARKGRRFFNILISGVAFTDPAMIQDLLTPLLSQLDGYDG